MQGGMGGEKVYIGNKKEKVNLINLGETGGH